MPAYNINILIGIALGVFIGEIIWQLWIYIS